ncbi:MAG: AAA family ATPase, partial [Chloroflexota bacterium]
MAQPHLLNLPPWLLALLRPQTYPHPTQKIELRQTQMSFVLLTGDYAYKIKKAVDLGYLDYTTLEKRRFFCRQEVKLNRRLCRGVYLGVVPIRSYRNRVTLGKKGKILEYAVKMRQLDDGENLDQLLAQDQVTPAMMSRLARKMARFHARAATSPDISRFGDLATIQQNWEENFSQTKGSVGRTLSQETYQAIQDYVGGFMHQQAALFQERIHQSRIRDCHGDLHAAHVNFAGPIYVYDCIEFNDRFRYGDVASEIAFLAMDLDFHHRPDLSRALVNSYVAITGDTGLAPLLPFYLCYRAYVRGKVDGFKLDDPLIPTTEKTEALARARRYFKLAQSYFTQPEKPQLIITTGLVATGKTVLAQALARRLGATLISSDPLRKELAGIPHQEHRFEEFGRGIYSRQFTQKTYQEMLHRAR